MRILIVEFYLLLSGIWGSISKMRKQLISIAMCTYNGEKYLEKQIDSIINQTYNNIELIIVDDCSSDRTVSIIKNYQKNYSFIKLFENELNLGFIKNFEKAISLCSGDYIALSDQDDVWKKNKLELFFTNIKDNVLIYSNAQLIDKNDIKIGELLINPDNLLRGNNNKAFLFDNCVSGNTLMFKKELIKYILPIPEIITFHDLWIAFIATTFGKIDYYHKPLTLYRRYADQVTHVNKKKSSNFLDRYNQKKIKKIKTSEKHLNNLKSFLSSELLKDDKTKYIIQELINYFEDYSNTFFNIKIYKILKENQNDIFAITNKNKRNKIPLKFSFGLKFHKFTFYIF